MSEQRDSQRVQRWELVLVAWVLIAFITVLAIMNASDTRDLQRRVGQLEELGKTR